MVYEQSLHWKRTTPINGMKAGNARNYNAASSSTGWIFSHDTRVFLGKVVRVLIVYVVVAIFMVGWFGKAALNGWDDYLRFFTNWSWTLEGVFYLFVAIGTLYEPVWNAVIRVLFLPVLTLAWFVWLMLQIIVATDPKLLDEVKEMPMKVFEMGNELYHPWPVILIMTVAAVEAPNIRRALHAGWYRSAAPVWLHLLNMLWSVYFPIWFGLLYCIANNPMEVYGITGISEAWVLAIGLGVSSVVGGLAFVFYMPYVSNKPV